MPIPQSNLVLVQPEIPEECVEYSYGGIHPTIEFDNERYPRLALPQIFHIRSNLDNIKTIFTEEVNAKGLNGEYIFEGRKYFRHGTIIIPVSKRCEK